MTNSKGKNKMKNDVIETEYSELLKTAIAHINGARNSLALQVNTTVNSAYWNLGKLLHDKKIEGGYGSNVINRLSVDLKTEFPDMGLSPRNLWYMKRFYERYYNVSEKLQRSVAVLSWRKNILLLEKKLSDEEILYYATESLEKSWNRNLLLNAIKMDVYSSHKNGCIFKP